MDFVKKKAFEAQINKVGKDLGFGSNITSGFSGSNAQEESRNPPWNVFGSREDADARDEPANDEFAISPEVANYYESMPYNFPPYIRLFYINRSILSDKSKVPVSKAFNVLCLTASLLVFNTLSAVLFTSLDKGKDWPLLLISAVMTMLLTVYELYTFEVAFRGAYQTSTRLRKQYLMLAAINIVIMSVYTFLGVGFLNGWTRLAALNKDDAEEEVEHETVRKVAVIIESILWTGLLLFNIHVLFEYYHLVQGRSQGLAPEAIAAANQALANADSNGNNDTISREGEAQRGRGQQSMNARTQEIRDRYRTDQV